MLFKGSEISTSITFPNCPGWRMVETDDDDELENEHKHDSRCIQRDSIITRRERGLISLTDSANCCQLRTMRTL